MQRDPGRDDKPCSNRQCVLGYAHDGPCDTEGWVYDLAQEIRALAER